MKTTLLIILAFFLSSCAPPPRGIPDQVRTAKSEYEVMKILDDHRFDRSLGGKQFECMEGYAPISLVEMYEMGNLEFEKLSSIRIPLFFLIGVPTSYTTMFKGKYGNIYKAKVSYIPDDNNHSLAHELSHAAGFDEPFGFRIGIMKYSDEQLVIMKVEGKSKWSDTQFYLNGSDNMMKYHYKW